MMIILSNFVPQRDPQSDPNCILRGQKTDPRRSRRGNGGQDGFMTPKRKPRDPPGPPKSSKNAYPKRCNSCRKSMKKTLQTYEKTKEIYLKNRYKKLAIVTPPETLKKLAIVPPHTQSICCLDTSPRWGISLGQPILDPLATLRGHQAVKGINFVP